MSLQTSLESKIESVLATTPPRSKERRKALSQIKWRLKSGLLYGGTDGTFANKPCAVGPEEAIVFDGRDSEKLKATWWKVYTGLTFGVELLP